MNDAPSPLPDDPRQALDRALAHVLAAQKCVNHANTRAAILAMFSSTSAKELAELVQAITNVQHRVMIVQRTFIEPERPKLPANDTESPTRQP